MSADRVPQYLEQMHAAAENARSFVIGMSEDAFLADLRTQMAVTMTLVIIGESTGRIMAAAPDFAAEHPEYLGRRSKDCARLFQPRTSNDLAFHTERSARSDFQS
jgi:hypothetical protein